MTVEKVAAWCREQDLLPQGGAVLACVSGGADSVCLLAILRALQPRWGYTLRACTFNHRLRGAEADGDVAFVQALCKQLDIPLTLGSADVRAEAARRGLGIEACARQLRYAFFREAAEGARIATAHNAEDNLETLLLHLARGSGLQGLGGIAPRRGDLIRPLLCLTRAEILAYLAENALPYREDSSNASDDYARNRLRHHALPALHSVNPRAAEAALTAAALLREDEAFLSGLAEDFLRKHCPDGIVPVDALLAAPRPVAARALRLLWGEALEAVHVQALLRLAASASPSGAADVPGGRVSREYGLLRFNVTDAPPLPLTPIRPGETLLLPPWRVSLTEEVFSGNIHKRFTTFPFKKSAVCGSMTIRSRLPGDSLRLSAGGGRKSLKKLFIEKKIPLRQRDSLPVICDEQGVLAVLGLGSDIRSHAVPGEEVMILRFEETLC